MNDQNQVKFERSCLAWRLRNLRKNGKPMETCLEAADHIAALEGALQKIYDKASSCDPSHYNATMTQIINIVCSEVEPNWPLAGDNRSTAQTGAGGERQSPTSDAATEPRG